MAMANANGLAQISIVDICRFGGTAFPLINISQHVANFQFVGQYRPVGEVEASLSEAD